MEQIAIAMRLRGHRQVSSGLKSTAGDVDKFGRSQDRAARSGDKLDRSTRRSRRGMEMLKTSAKVGGLVLGGALVVGAKKSIAAFEEARKVSAQTGAVIKSTGGVANVSGKDVDVLTAALMRKTAIDDETVRKGANMLLTFTNIRNEAGKTNKVFDQSVIAATDMATALGSDPRSAALMLGKALNDPAKGLGRLTRSGVMFSDSQKKQIESLQESGDLLGAQKIILREVGKEFGGSAAAAKTPMMALNTSLGELSETVGAFLAPTVDKGAVALTKFVTQMQTGKGAGGQFVAVLTQIWAGIKPVAVGAGQVASALGRFGAAHPSLVKVAGAIVAVGLAVKTISFASKITGVGKLLSGLGALGRTTAGQKAKAAILRGFEGLSGGISRKTAPARTALVNTMGAAGGSGGKRASNAVITQTAAGLNAETKLGGKGRIGGAAKGLGRMMGPLMGAAAAVLVVQEIQAKLKDAGFDLDPIATGGSPGSYDPPSPLEQLLGIGGAKGGLVTPHGIVPGYASGGWVPRGEDTLAGLRHGEFVMRREAVRREGVGTMAAINRGDSISGDHVTRVQVMLDRRVIGEAVARESRHEAARS